MAKKTSIGGQALLEGIMMRGPEKTAMAVRHTSGEIVIEEDPDGKLVWVCPNCGNRDQDKMNVARRTCGYIGTQFWNQGRTQEIRERVLHL